MKKRFNNTFWTILVSCIAVFSTVYANANCHERIYSPCSGPAAFVIPAEGPAGCCAYEAGADLIAFASGNGEGCCAGRLCISDKKPVAGTQYPNIQGQFTGYSVDSPRPPNGDKALNTVFSRYKTVIPIPIYTLTQSFLC